MRRRCREAYRLNRRFLPQAAKLDIAFIYVGEGVTPYDRTASAMKRLLHKIAASVPATTSSDAQAE